MLIQIPITEAQESVLFHPAKNLAVVGGRGSAKTRTGCLRAQRWLEQYPGVPFGIAADTFGKLRSNFVQEFTRHLTESGLVEGEHYRHLRGSHKFVYANGASLQYFSMDKPPEKTKGPTLGGVIFDEADQIGEDHFDIFSVCARDPRGPREVLVLANGVPPAHWINTRFSGSGLNRLESSDLIRVSSYDNPFLPDDEIKRLENLYPVGSDEWKRWVLGLNTPLKGAVYSAFDPSKHVVHQSQQEPLRVVFAGLDLGVRDPTVLLVAGLDSSGTLWLVDEWVSEEGMAPQEQALHMAPVLERNGVPRHKRDTMIFSDHSLTHRKALEYEGIYTLKAEKAVQFGINLVTRRIANNYLRIVRGKCPVLEQSLQLYRYRAGNKEQLEHEHSHAPDALRYLVVGADGDTGRY